MGLCSDKSTDYLKGLGYNVVRVPREGISPLTLVGSQRGASASLGKLENMFVPPAPAVPAVETGLESAEINGKQSSKLDISIGANILGTLIGAMGGNLGVKTEYTTARQISFVYKSVVSDRVDPLLISQFIEAATFNPDGPLIHPYVLGNGRLFVISETIKSSEFTVMYEISNGVEAKVEVPAIEGLVKGNISISSEGANSASITFKGEKKLVFGFRCLELGVVDGRLQLTLAKGAVPLAAGTEPAQEDFAILTDPGAGLLELGEDA